MKNTPRHYLNKLRKLRALPKHFLSYLRNRYIRKIGAAKPPIFVVGCGHSGNTVLLAILGSHSKIYSVPYESNIAMRKRPKLWLKFFDMLAISEGKNRWAHKKPRNIHRIDKLLEISHDAKILLVI